MSRVDKGHAFTLPRAVSLSSISRKLSRAVDQIENSSGAAFTYNPLNYARVPHEQYLKAYGGGTKRVLLLGMNPGPFGMAQTGVPFGDVVMVRDYLNIKGMVKPPPLTHPKRPILGFDCPRREVSGTRLWGFAQEHFPKADDFFRTFFVVNYCPLVFMEESSKNLTPDKLPKEYREELYRVCDDAVRATVSELNPDWVLGVGAFAQKRAMSALADYDIEIGTILHPSPASPRANQGWSNQVRSQLEALGISLSG